MRTRIIRGLPLAIAVLLVLPLKTPGGQAECCNTTGSLASTMNNPTSGDEQFFTLPVGPANIMFLLDSSGSMENLPQCGDMTANNGWGNWSVKTCTGGSNADRTCSTNTDCPSGTCTPRTSCVWPTLPALPSTNTTGAVGSCDMSGNSQLSWMNGYTVQTAYADPGNGTNSLLTDKPAWGTGCTGDACLFDPNGYYIYGEWTETTAKHRDDCTAYDSTNTAIKDAFGNLVTADLAACRACMATAGFYFFNVKYVNGKNSGGAANSWTTSGIQARFRGGWLNDNPPKFAAARKVIKDLVWMDPAKPSSLDSVRFGLSILGATSSINAAQIVVPVGPDRPTSFPATQVAFVPTRQLLLDALNRKIAGLPSYMSGGTPLAGALFNIGQYFSSPGLYTTKFGSKCGTGTQSCEPATYAQSVSGLANAPWAQNNSNQCSFCWACQQSSVIIVTDGSPNTEMKFPPAITSADDATFTSNANCGASGAKCVQPVDGKVAIVPRVASWLHNTDLRTDLTVSDPQAITTSTVSFGVADGAVRNILNATANMGGGSYAPADDAKDLAAKVTKAVNDVVTRANSFSAPAAASLATIHTVASDVFLTRFKPNDTPTWEGHVFQGILFDEFLAGCDPTLGPTDQPKVACGPRQVFPNFNGDTDSDGHNICTGAFLVDLDCDEVIEDPKTGAFLKKGSGNQPARMVWDAGQTLSDPTKAGYRSAKEGQASSRTIWTAIPSTTAGNCSAMSYSMIKFETANAAALAPFMNLSQQWCKDMLTTAKLCNFGSAPACTSTWTAADQTACATQVINFVRGFDVLDGDGDLCAGPNNPNNVATTTDSTGASQTCGTAGEERDRIRDNRTANPVFWKLGDIFHSSPVLVKPPTITPICDTGRENQCVQTLYSQFLSPSPTKLTLDNAGCNTSAGDAYEGFRYAKRGRKRAVLIGANDGMVHAFDAGDPDTSQAEDKIFCNRPFTQGNGSELWAFLPPDMLPRIKDAMFGHQYLVDGSTMVREVWVDGNSDGIKQAGEFKTVAISTERAGGTQFNALDITDPTTPKFLWTFPPPGSEDARWKAQAWSEFAPRAPPIGPVRLKRAGMADPQGRGFEERWIVMVNGGYDPALGLGRAVWMLDVNTGAVLWRFTDDDFKAQLGFGSGTSMFPIPGAIGLTDIGDTTKTRFDGDGFFDTATWGDLGGNLFVARFQDPGVVDNATGRVTNWFAARTFEQQRRTDDLQFAAGRSEFFFMTANSWEGTAKALHVLDGAGNLERLMQQGNACGPDNLLACCRAGCSTVDATSAESYGACGFSNHFRCQSGQMTRDATTSTCTSAATCAAAPGNASTSHVTLQFNCPGPGSVPDVTGSTSCDINGACSVTPIGTGKDVSGTFSATCPKTRFYSVLGYGNYPEKMFSDQATAKRFDQARFTDVPSFTATPGCDDLPGKNCALVDTTRASATTNGDWPTCPAGVTKCWATELDPGWFYEYGDVCSAQSCPSSGSCTNEKTGSAGTVLQNCAVWNGFQPVSAQSGNDPCSGTVGTPVTFSYASHYVMGTPTATCGYAGPDGTQYRAQQRNTVAPPSTPLVRVSMSPSGEISYSALQIDPGAPPSTTQTGTRSSIADTVYFLEVPRDVHACRHDYTSSAKTCE